MHDLILHPLKPVKFPLPFLPCFLAIPPVLNFTIMHRQVGGGFKIQKRLFCKVVGNSAYENAFHQSLSRLTMEFQVYFGTALIRWYPLYTAMLISAFFRSDTSQLKYDHLPAGHPLVFLHTLLPDSVIKYV